METIYEDEEDYAILGVKRGVSLEDLRKAYKRLCLQYHPDKNGSSEDFIRLTEAYQNVQRHIERNHSTPSPETDFTFLTFMCDMLLGYMRKVQKNTLKAQIHVKLSDIVNEKVKKITVNLKRLKAAGDVVKEKKELYIGLCLYQSAYEFKAIGDEYAPQMYGDISIGVVIDCERGYSIIDKHGGTLLYEMYIPLYTYLYSDHIEFTYLNGNVIRLANNNEPVTILKGYGCVRQDGDYGDLHVRVIPYVPDVVKESVRNDCSLKEKIQGYFAAL